MRAKKKKAKLVVRQRKPATAPPKGQPQLLAAVVKSKGSGAVVAQELGCSQQSVSEWMRGSWAPRSAVQKKMKELYGIPAPWPLTKGT